MSAEAMEQLGQVVGRKLSGGEVIELIGDIGAGKTTFVRGLARGLDITEQIQSPSFTINCHYQARDNLVLNHYDFYRLNEAGIMSMELAETINDPNNVTVIEWGGSINDVLPKNHIKIKIDYLPGSGRDVTIITPGK